MTQCGGAGGALRMTQCGGWWSAARGRNRVITDRLTEAYKTTKLGVLKIVLCMCDLIYLYPSEVYYGSPIDGTHWLPNKEMTKLWGQ